MRLPQAAPQTGDTLVSSFNATAASTDLTGSPGRRRWLICSLLFFATTLNYTDRQILGLLAPLLQVKFGWDEKQYGYTGAAFLFAYALGLVLMGRVTDRIGTKKGYTLSIAIWSVAAMSHALARNVFGFAMARFALGFGEAGNFPSAIKAVAEWFPRKERALATGIFNSGTSVGATIAPLVVPWIAVHLGWQFAFLFTGVFSVLWLICWLTIYRSPQDDPHLSSAELSYITAEHSEPSARLPWGGLLLYPQTWAFVLGKFFTDPVWWFFLFWLPKFFSSVHGVSLLGLGLPLIIIYNSATVGSIFGGWLAARLLKHGYSMNRARKTAMFVCAAAITPVVFAGKIQSLWGAVAIVSLAVAAHQGWSSNLLTLVSDLFPKNAVGSVVGIGSFVGSGTGAMAATFIGFLLQATHSYVPIFVIAGSVYLLALLVIHSFVPRLEPVGEL
jgi:MFS transporter, ACS family, hexuronate transporter